MLNQILLCTFLHVLILSSSLPDLTPSSMDGSYFLVQISSTDPSQCSNCESEAKQLVNAGKVLEGIVKVGKANTNTVSALKTVKLSKNPSYALFKGSLTNYVQYTGKVSRISFCKFVLSEIQKTIKEKDQKLFGSRTTPKENKDKKQSKSSNEKKDSNGVIALTDANFEDSVLKGEQAWFVEFYSPSCGHCQALQPEWDKLPGKIGKRVKIAKIDATQNRGMAQKYQIKGFPTLFLFVGDKKSPVQYQNQRTAQAMVEWLLTQPIGEQKLQFEKLSKEKYDKQCNRNIVCLIFILDSKSELKQLDFMEEVMEEEKGKPLRFFYSKRLPYLEQSLMIEDRSTPKLVSVWDSLNSYKIYNGKQEKEELQTYLTKIMERRSWIKLQDGKIGQKMFHDNEQL